MKTPLSFGFRILHHWLLNACLLGSFLVSSSHALGSGGRAFLSRLESAQCALQLSVGRIPGTAMPPEWAASGARLGLEVEIEFCPEVCADYDMNKERLLGPARKPSFQAVEPLNEPTFVSSKGTEHVAVTSGAYGCELQDLQAQKYGLRFFLDFPEGAVRNDVALPAERIYFISTAWIDDEGSSLVERARKRRDEMTQSLLTINNELIAMEQESSVLAKAMGLRQSVKLVEKKGVLRTRLDQLEQAYPLQGQLVEGPNGLLFAKEGFIAVKRMRGALGTREQYHFVGTFAFDDFFDDEYEDEGEE